jgi:predicted ATPase/DNA-binding SARP family transcriptional activator
MITVHTLGRLLIKQDDTPITGFVSQKTVALFVYLVAHPGIHQRDVLAELFWSETSGKQALKNLRTVLSNLQKNLEGYLDVTRQTLAIINKENIWFDINAFDQNLDEIEERSQYPFSPRQKIDLLADAINLYQGEFLVGLKAENAPELDTWIMLERERLHSRVVKALFAITEVALENGYYAQGITHGRRLLTLEPWWEEAQQNMMRLLAYNGNRNAALQQYSTFVHILKDELDVEPEDSTQQLYKEIKTKRFKTTPRQRPNNLQRAEAPYVEDTSTVDTIMALLNQPGCRLLTLLGPGGIGKTHLSQHIAHKRLEDHTDGVFFVPLASLTTPNFVAQAILTAIGITQHDTKRPARDILIEKLADQHLLLVLDNFEHILDATELINDVLNHTAFVQIIVTSREQLNIAHEQILPVSGLPEAVAMTLFNTMAQKQTAQFDDAQHHDAVRQICRLVDGLPLGVIIAAGWVSVLSPEDIAARITDGLGFLTAQNRDLPERHQGIIALLNSTWQALNEEQRQAMMRISVFPGDFSAEAALYVGQTHMTVLRQLVTKSLLQTNGQGRYILHELLRRYVQEKADEIHLLDDARQAHYAYYYTWADRLYHSGSRTHQQIAAIDLEYHNLWHFDWLPAPDQRTYILHLARILTNYWLARGDYLQESIALIEQGLLGDAPPASRAFAQSMLARMRFDDGVFTEETRTMLQEALHTAEKLDDTPLVCLALNELKRLEAGLGNFERAREYSERMIVLYEEASDAIRDNWAYKDIISKAYTNLGVTALQMGDYDVAYKYATLGLEVNLEEEDDVGTAVGYNTLGIIALEQDDYGTAHKRFSQALTLAQTIQYTRLETIFSGNLAEALYKQGYHEQAYHMYCDTLHTAYRINNRKTMVNVLEQLADVALALDDAPAAARLYGAANSIREELHLAIQPREVEPRKQRQHRLEQALGEQHAHRLLTEGGKWSMDDVVNFAASALQ